MMFETIADIERERKAIKSFIKIFKGSFKKLGEHNADYKILNKEEELIAYAKVQLVMKPIKKAFPLSVNTKKLVKLSDKRLNPIMIWGCEDGLIYCPIDKLNGEIRWSKESELMAYFNYTNNFKYIKYT